MDEYFKSSFMKRFFFKIRTQSYYHLFFKKKFASIRSMPVAWGIWNIDVYGPNIHIGENVVFVAAEGSRSRLTTIKLGRHEGQIEIGNNVLVMNGVRLSSASRIIIGDDCMLANFCYLTDADWHDLHDRTEPVGKTAPIVLKRGVWIGDSAIICKGVTVGENSVIGAGSVVRRDVPANVVVSGNPARVVRKLDPDKVVTMGKLYEKMGRPEF
jgi:acetyltransferase-like isoleucine patch superfamily enzyme